MLKFEKREDWCTKKTYYEVRLITKHGNAHFAEIWKVKNGYEIYYNDEVIFSKTLKEAKMNCDFLRWKETA